MAYKFQLGNFTASGSIDVEGVVDGKSGLEISGSVVKTTVAELNVVRTVHTPETVTIAKILEKLYVKNLTKTLDKLITARIDNTVNAKFIDDLYDFDSLPMETFLQRRTLNRKIEDYKSTTDMLLKLAEQGKTVGIQPEVRTTYDYYKTKDGYRIKEIVESKSELDVRYYWDIVSNLLDKFSLSSYIKKNPPLTLIDKKQQSIMEWI